MQSLIGKVAFVTGGSRGIGFAVARALITHGANVAITARDESSLLKAKAALEATGPGAVIVAAADVRQHDDVERAVVAAVKRFGGLDILVNNAGLGIFAKVQDMTPVQWATVVETNLSGVYHACHLVLPHLQRRGGGFIINISSLAGSNPFSGGAAYCASKAGLNAFSEALMQEVRHDNIRVSYIQPGSVATEFSGGDASAGADWKLAPDDVARVVMDLLGHDARSLPSRVELRPSKPRK